MKHVVGFSGGVDSQMCVRWVRDHYPDDDIIVLNSQAGRNEHPITQEFVKWYSENIFPVIEVVPLIRDLEGRGTRPGKSRDRRQEFSEDDELTFNRLAYIKGRFPSRTMQFCTEHLKLSPVRRWIRENLKEKGVEFVMYSGVRCDESAARADTQESKRDDYFDCEMRFPIRCWTKLECFAVLKHRGEPVNPLYKMGFGRVGCAPCINSGKDDIREWAARSPETIDKIREWEKEVGATFFAPCVPGLEINWIDEVVEWSRTARGGKQPLLMFQEADAAKGVCSSKYGLCE